MLLYFAYGSNLKAERLRSRVGEFGTRGIARLADHQLCFAKRGKDGSGKACFEAARGDHVWGVLYALDHVQLSALDAFELGYSRVTVRLEHVDGTSVDAVTYRAEQRTDEPVPFAWYKALLVEGAREHGLPQDWQRRLEAISSKEDPRPR